MHWRTMGPEPPRGRTKRTSWLNCEVEGNECIDIDNRYRTPLTSSFELKAKVE